MKKTRKYVETMAYPAVHTAQELLEMQEIPGKVVELVRGRLIVREPPGFRHGRVGTRLAAALFTHVESRDLGLVLSQEVGFKLASNPDTVRAPDVAFIGKARVPDPQFAGYPDYAPDLVVEVVSPTDRSGFLLSRVGDWLIGGARLVWVIDPARRVARVYRADGTDDVVLEGEALEGEDILPGFKCPMTAIL